jgi:hypothetical protein
MDGLLPTPAPPRAQGTREWPKIARTKRDKPLGSTSPHVWVIEPSFGCNLACGHCCAKLIEEEDKSMMSEATWRATFATMNAVSPTVRVDVCGVVGEPTLHPHLTEWLAVARELAPRAQIQITTNGTRLLAKQVTYEGLLDAGANVVYTDQYGPPGRFERLAEASGYPFYHYYTPTPGAPTPWMYYGPDAKFIVLMNQPEDWPKSRYRAGLLGNWYGNLDWEAGKEFGMRPLLEPLTRRCNQPFLYVTVAASGEYLLCCQDGMHVSAGRFGTVLDGVEGFRRFWYGREMQLVRRRLRLKNRADTDYACAKCNITFSRCDFKHWKDDQVASFWDGQAERSLDDDPGVGRFVSDGPRRLFP